MRYGGKRSERLAEQLREELSVMIQQKLKDPRIGFVTITRVTVTSDMRYAKVYYSVLGSASERAGTTAALEHSAGYLQRALKELLTIRTIPKISFTYDPSVEASIALDVLIQKIHDEK